MVRPFGSFPVVSARRLCLAVALALIASGCERFSSPEESMDAARSAIERKETGAAIIQLKNVLQRNPDFAEARFELGRIYLQMGDTPSAVKELKKALELGIPELAVAPSLARAMVESGDADGAAERFGSTTLADPLAQSELLAALGYGAMQTGKPEAANERFDAALALRGDDPYARLGKARLIASQGDIDGGLALLGKVMEAGNGGHEAWFLDADIKAAQGKLDEALQSYRKVYEIKPDHLRSRFTVIVGLTNEGRLEEARKEVAAFRKQAPKAPEGNYLDALLLIREKKPVLARERLNKLLSGAPDFVPGLVLAAINEFDLQSFALAEQHAEKAISLGGDSLATRKVLIASHIRMGRPLKAQQALAPLLKARPDDPAVLSLAGQVHLAAGNAAAASEAFARAVAKSPEDSAARSRLGLSKLAQGDTAGGLDALETAARLDTDDAKADIVLIVTHLRSGNARGALNAVAAMEKKRPQDPMTHNLRGTALLMNKDVPGARQSFEHALTLQKDFFPAAANLAKLDMVDKRLQDAEGRYQSILAINPGHAEALTALAGLKALERKDAPAAVKLFEKAIEANPQLSTPRILLAQLYLASNDFGKAMKAAGEAAVTFPEDISVLDTLALAQSAAGEHDAAVSTRSRIVARNPQNVMALMALANVQLSAGRDTEAVQSSRKALSIQPDLLDAYSMLVRIHMKQKNLEEALRVAREMQKRHPKESEGFSKEGEILLAVNRPEQALKPLRDAYALQRKSDNVIMLYVALDRAGNAKDAAALAEEWFKSSPRDPKVRIFLGDMALGRDRHDEARRYYEQVIELLPESPVILNNLAWLALKRSDPKAREYAEKAYRLSPTAPAIMDTYGEILVGVGETERGLEILREAVVSAPHAPEFRFTLARALIKTGKTADARKELEMLASLGARYRRSGEAAALLKTL